MFQIGPYTIASQTILAPMAGVTDQPFRQLCRRYGAGLVVSEMLTSDTRLWKSRKSSYRMNYSGEAEPRSVQIAGSSPDMMADAARMCAEHGAQIIDINMGCPAKKVCNKAAGSALLRDEPLVGSIISSVVNAVDLPVTLKYRTGWDAQNKNALTVAKIAQDNGIQALALHGRTRACGYKGEAEYDTIAAVKQAVNIPVFANGDINSAQKAKFVLEHTKADAVMIGRGAQGKPWLFRDINTYLSTGKNAPPPSFEEIRSVVLEHLQALHGFYGDYLGVRIARKHVGWYLQDLPEGKTFRKTFNSLDEATSQIDAVARFFEHRQDLNVA
ncbi:MAG: tRNA dihydrouridine synthase DusB [Pontibacterium sp.]